MCLCLVVRVLVAAGLLLFHILCSIFFRIRWFWFFLALKILLKYIIVGFWSCL